MVDILSVVKEGPLVYGSKMENDSLLQDWLQTRNRRLSHAVGSYQTILSKKVGSITGTLLKDVEVETSNSDLLGLVRSLIQKSQNSRECLSHMTDIGKALNDAKNQKLLSLSLAYTSGRPFRYCYQFEVVPLASYWNYYATHQIPLKNSASKICIVVVDSDQPALDACRFAASSVAQGLSVILLPKSRAILPCLILAEVINGVLGEQKINVFLAEDHTELLEASKMDHVRVMVCSNRQTVQELSESAHSLDSCSDGMTAIVAMESGDIDGAVDSAVMSLKRAGAQSCGVCLLVQDCLLEDVSWRLRQRFIACRSGHILGHDTDLGDHTEFAITSSVIQYLETTNLEVLKVGNAQIVWNAQPSIALTQESHLGQTLLVMSFRTFTELCTLLNNLSNLSGISCASLWLEHQATAWTVVERLHVQQIWLNGTMFHQPGCDQPLNLRAGSLSAAESAAEKVVPNIALYPQVDALCAAQRAWAANSLRNKALIKPVTMGSPDCGIDLTNLLQSDAVKGHIMGTGVKDALCFRMDEALGVVALLATGEASASSLVDVLILTLLAGNTVALCSSEECDAITQSFIRALKEAGLSQLVSHSCYTKENVAALQSHHGISKIILTGSATLVNIQAETKLKCLWRPEDQNLDSHVILQHVTRRKWVWMTTGDGLAV